MNFVLNKSNTTPADNFGIYILMECYNEKLTMKVTINLLGFFSHLFLSNFKYIWKYAWTFRTFLRMTFVDLNVHEPVTILDNQCKITKIPTTGKQSNFIFRRRGPLMNTLVAYSGTTHIGQLVGTHQVPHTHWTINTKLKKLGNTETSCFSE